MTTIKMDIDNCWYELAVTDISAIRGYPAKLTGHPDTWEEGCDDDVCYTVMSVKHGTEDGDEVFMSDEELNSFTEAYGEIIDAAVLESLQ